MAKLPLYKQIENYYKDQIVTGQLRYRDRVPSEQEIMDEFRVSKITVKNALSALADEGFIIRVQGKGTFVDKMIQRLPVNMPVEQASAADTANLIGFIIPTMKTKVIQKMVEYVEQAAKEAGYQMILHIARESSAEEAKSIKQLIDVGVRGIIVFPTEDENYSESLLRLSLDKFPFVLIDRYLRNVETYQIISDNIAGAYETVSYLLDQNHREIALVSPDNTNTTIEDRTLGFEKAYIDRHISIDKNLWCHVPLDILRAGEGGSYVTSFLVKHPAISAIFTLSAEMAQLTHASLHKLSRKNVELVTFDDPDIPGISYVMQDELRLAQAAITLLNDQIRGEYAPCQTVIPVKLHLVDQIEVR